MDRPKVALVAGSFHVREMAVMLAAAERACADQGFNLAAVSRVPGSYEKPLAVRRLLLRDDIAAAVVIGIIERGETAHGRIMGQAVADALIRLQLEFMKPIGIGIIGPEADPDQFEARLEPYATAAVAAVAVMLGGP